MVLSEITQVIDENRHELVLTGKTINSHLTEDPELDTRLYNLTKLNFLKITQSTLSSLSENIKNLDNLTNLVLAGNKLEVLPSGIGDLEKLKLFDASHNSLSSIPESLGKLKNLATLNLNNNNLKTFPDLSKCVSLAHLDIRHNSLDTFPIIGEEQVHLADVFLSSNQITSIPEDISSLVSLKLLDLSNNAIEVTTAEICSCQRLKDFNLKGNNLKDKRFRKLVENNRTQTKQVLDYMKQHCSQEGSKKGKSGAKAKGACKEDEIEKLCDKLMVTRVSDATTEITAEDVVKSVRPYIVCCVVNKLDISGDKFKQFLAIQTQIHENECEKRLAATIATHDMSKISSPLKYTLIPSGQIRVVPLGYSKQYSGAQFLAKLQKEAENQRKNQKRNNVSGIHKYLNQLEGIPEWACLVNSDGTVLSIHPLTNADKSKISPETSSILIEVTSNSSLTKAKEVMEKLILSLVKLGATSDIDDAGNKIIHLQQIRVCGEDGGAKVVFPARTDFNLENSNISVVISE